jgi:hypothetical protein
MCTLMLALLASPSCQAVHKVAPAETFTGLAQSYFRDSNYGRAILLATNARSRSGESGYMLIQDPNSLKGIPQVCIPKLPEANFLRRRYDAYQKAVRQTVLPEPSQVSHSLMSVDPKAPVHVISWIRPEDETQFKHGEDWVITAPPNVWVTVEPEVKSFCQAFSAAHRGNLDLLTSRLEQRLGLPPGAGYVKFLEITIQDPSSTARFFRPCNSSPAADTTTCDLSLPAKGDHANWIFQQYYSAFAQAKPDQYRWTSLGYTFDWAAKKDGSFVRYGASEFVIAEGTPIRIDKATDTAAYCALQK